MPRQTNLPAQLCFTYALFILYATTIPFAFHFSAEYLQAKLAAFGSNPFQLKTAQGFGTTDIVSNVLLFAPLGFLFVSARLTANMLLRRRHVILQAGFAGLALSVLVESLQLFLETRTTSAIDLIANAAGVTIGAGVALRYQRYFQPHVLKFAQQQLARSPQLTLFYAYAALLFLSQLAPFAISLDVSTLKKAVKSIDFYLPQTAAHLGELSARSILFAAFGFLWLRTRERNREPKTIFLSVLLTLGAATVIECAQLFIVSHTATLRNLLAGLEGGLYGAVLHLLAQMRAARVAKARRVTRSHNLALNLALGHWLSYYLLMELQPYAFNFSSASLSRKMLAFHWLPFIEYYNRTEPLSLFDLSKGLAYFALLTLLLLYRLQPRQINVSLYDMLIIAGIAVGLSGLVEIAQLGLPARASGVTDGVNSVLGVAAGWWLWQQRRITEVQPRLGRGFSGSLSALKSKPRQSRG